ncbi:hypothetical protein VPH35_048712 [Triticum aestivum]
MNSSCPLPHWDQLPYFIGIQRSDKDQSWELLPNTQTVGSFVNCSRAVPVSNEFYQYSYTPVPCLSNNHSFVYIVTSTVSIEYLAPSCGYLAMFLLSDPGPGNYYNFSHYADFVKHLRLGFSVRFPLLDPAMSIIGQFNRCLDRSFRVRYRDTGDNIESWTMDILLIDFNFWSCIFGFNLDSNNILDYMRAMIHDQSGHQILPPVFALVIATWIVVLCRFLLAPLAVLIFLAQNYWKTRITIDAVEKFLQMQQMIGPTRYAYTDIVALTSHFRDKLGQGGYGSVFKGVLLPGNVNIAVKMLEGSSNYNGEDFISEVSTIGRIHHVNVVRLAGFCSEEMRRALVYEYMPRGSLDKYIFSA